MEGNGTEVTQKIRSLITNKLVELGVYVDEELPDYIMVMVANKKSKIHMSDDLMLFLGNHTTVFTNWLNGILESLPSSVSSDKKCSAPQKASCQPPPADSGSTAMEDVPTERDAPRAAALTAVEEVEEMFSFKEEETDDFLSDELNREAVVPPSSQERVPVPKDGTTTTTNGSSNRAVAPSPTPHKKTSVKSGLHLPSSLAKISSSEQTRAAGSTLGFCSRVAAKVRPMVQSRQAYEEEDEYDPRNPAVGSVASVVRVTERKWSVPPALQANKLLLLKAMDDANRSVKRTGIRRPPTPVEPYQPTPIPRPVPREENTAAVAEESDLRLFLKGRNLEGIGHVVVGHAATVLPTIPPPPLPQAVTRGIKRKAEQQSEVSPKFVVTLDGIDPAKLVRDVISTSDSLQLQQDNEDDKQEDSLGEGEEEEEEEGADKVMERCRYWPACRNGDSCTRHHPTVPCKSFPSCRFGEKCLYIHPNCRFDSRCSRKDCPYTHASKRRLRSQPPAQVTLVVSHSMKKKTPCKYFPNCSTYGCVYLHPKLCRFGGQCRAPSCPFGHPLPSPEKLKWVAQLPS